MALRLNSMKIKELAIKHDYYCSEMNFYSNEPSGEFENFEEFLEEFADADVDMNLVFRWDVREYNESGREDEELFKDGYYMEIFMMLQRKGIYKPIFIKEVSDKDASNIKKYLKKHHEKLMSLWKPF